MKKIPKDPSAKADLDRYYLVIPGEKELLVELQGWQEEEDAILAKAFADTTTAKLLVAGYESIESSGSPGLSQSAPKEATEWIPANYGWNVKKVIYLMSIKVLPSEPEKMEKK